MEDLSLEDYIKSIMSLPDEQLILEVENMKKSMKKFLENENLTAEERATLTEIVTQLEETGLVE